MSQFTEIRSAKQALKESKALKSVWSAESWLTQRVLIYIAGLLEQNQKPKQRRKPSKWQQHVAAYLRAGKTINQAADDWKSA